MKAPVYRGRVMGIGSHPKSGLQAPGDAIVRIVMTTILGTEIDGIQAEYVRTPHANTSLHPFPADLDEEAHVMLPDGGLQHHFRGAAG